MGQLLYDRLGLEERSGKNFGCWKGCHIATYSLAAIFGLLNCYFLYLTCMRFDQLCVLDPHKLVFSPLAPELTTLEPAMTEVVEVADLAAVNDNVTFLVLDIQASQFRVQSYCEWQLLWPLLAAVVAAVWVAMFVVCPAGGHSTAGLKQPWRIVPPALLFSLVFVGAATHTFVRTNRGLVSLCAQFEPVTNTTSCDSEMDAHMPPHTDRHVSASVGVMLTRAACGASLASWIVASAMLLARCLGGADFALHRTQVQLIYNRRTPPTSAREQARVSPSDVNAASASQQVSSADDFVSGSTVSSAVNTPREADRETSLVSLD